MNNKNWKEQRLAFTKEAEDIVSKMTLEEKVNLMSGNSTLYEVMAERKIKGKHANYDPVEAGGNEKYHVPVVKFADGPRGAVCFEGKTTCFPVAMNRGASFDIELEERIGHAIGEEVRACGANLYGGICVNVPYNPGWGRSQEVYGEDSFALGAMGAALIRGVQSESVIACVKHLAFNSMENSRFHVNIDCDKRTEREVFLPHFEECVRAGAGCIMSSYNLYKGEFCGQNQYLLRDVLKNEWDFDGFVISDWILGIRDTLKAANAGMDIEMPDTKKFGSLLIQAVQEGKVEEKIIDEAAVRIVRTMTALENQLKENGKGYPESLLGCTEHIDLALRSAEEGIILLKNENEVLPIQKDKKKIAVFGKLAIRENTGDHGSSRVYPAYTVTPLEGIQSEFPDAEITYCSGEETEEAKQIAEKADVVIVVAGYDYNDEGEFIGGSESAGLALQLLPDEQKGDLIRLAQGFDAATVIGGTSSKEGGDRKEGLQLHQDEIELIQTVTAVNRNSIVILIGGNAIMMDEWSRNTSAVLFAFYPGQEGGTAIGRILNGKVNPSAKLPFVLPEKESDLPQVNWETTEQWYDYYHGYAKLEKEGITPYLPYGFGMSYTTFEISDAVFDVTDQTVNASCTVTNTGKRDGTEVIQMYIGFKNSKLDRPVKLLRGFQRISLRPGESGRVKISCPIEKLRYYDENSGTYNIEHMEYEIYIGSSSAEKDLLQGTFVI